MLMIYEDCINEMVETAVQNYQAVFIMLKLGIIIINDIIYFGLCPHLLVTIMLI